VIVSRLSQPLKAYLPIFSAPAISTLASFLQPAKASDGISLTLAGIATALRAAQPSNAPAPIVSTPSAIVNVLSALTSLNAPTPIYLTFSGIATATNQCVKLVEGTNASIADTRKTLPGLRALQKYSVTVGGGKNHRYNLSDCAMLKDNHIDAKGGITPAVKALREKIGHTVKIEVETRTLDEVKEALNAGADIIMLDNMDNATMAEAVKIVDGKALLEASGNLTKERLRSVAELGVDILSIGALTHSVEAFDISMRMK
jgi:nicotinate-nucleotide pyrophosphorylase